MPPDEKLAPIEPTPDSIYDDNTIPEGHAAQLVIEPSEPSDPLLLIAQLKEQIAALMGQQIALEEKIAANQHEAIVRDRRENACTCKDKDFFRTMHQPAYSAAERIYGKAKAIAEEKMREQADKQKNVKIQVKRILISAGIKKNVADEQAQKIAEELVEIKDLKKDHIVHVLESAMPKKMIKGKTPPTINEILTKNNATFLRLAEILGANKPMKVYIRKMFFDKVDITDLPLDPIWREGLESLTREKRAAVLKSISETAIEANKQCLLIFNTTRGLHPDIIATNHLSELTDDDCITLGVPPTSPHRKGLRSIVAETDPITDDDFWKLMSAQTKINTMHRIETINNQVRFKENKRSRDHLERATLSHAKEMEDGTWKIFTGSVAANKPDPDPQENFSARCAKVKVADDKTFESMLRKSFLKDAEDTLDYDVSAFYDQVRFMVMLTPEDSATPEKIEAATIKILAVLFAKFGTDISISRLRISFRDAKKIARKINEDSTGKAEFLNFTIRYRKRCRSNLRDERGQPKVTVRYVEGQIRKFMTDAALVDDHNDYKQNQAKKITVMTGMKTTFAEFITDLCDPLLRAAPKPAERLVVTDDVQYNFHENMARVIMKILTIRHEETDHAVNASTISELHQDKYQWEKLKKVVEMYMNYEPQQVREFKEKYLSQPQQSADAEYTDWQQKLIQQLHAPQDSLNKIFITEINYLARAAAEVMNKRESMQKNLPSLD